MQRATPVFTFYFFIFYFLFTHEFRQRFSGIGISFCNPYILSSFPDMKTYIVAYGDMPSLQRAAARAILGTQDITGHLPITLPGLHPRGTGIQMMKK